MTPARAPAEHKRRLVAAIRAARLDLGDAARAAKLTLPEAALVLSEGLAAGRLRLVDDGPGFRFIEDTQWPAPAT